MKIMLSRRDEIEKRRKEYDDETQILKDKQEELENSYHSKLNEQTKALESKVSEAIGPTSLDLNLRVDPYGLSAFEGGWSVNVRVNEKNMFDDSTALSWSWDVGLDKNGNITKDSGSWSGLKATTPEQIADLEESVRVIKVLNNIDWKEVLNAPKAKYSDYVDSDIWNGLRQRKQDRPAFEDELLAAELEDLIGTNTAVKLSDDPYWRGNVWMLLTGLTDKFAKGYVFPQYFLTDRHMNADMIKNQIGEERRVAKTKIVKDGSDSLATLDVDKYQQ